MIDFSSVPDRRAVLSIQSAVIYGAVGNDAAMAIYTHFELSAFRLDTVRLAAHPGFGEMYAAITPSDALDRLLENFFRLDAAKTLGFIQTGYLGDASQVPVLAHHITELKIALPACEYCLDPVMGDAGKLYVDKALSTALIQTLLPLADHLTPNLFELEILAGRAISSKDEAINAADQLRSDYQLSSIIVTGIPEDDVMTDIVITDDGIAEHSHRRELSGVSGAGDMFTACYLAGLSSGLTAHLAAHQASEAVTQCTRLAADRRTLPVAEWLASQS
jgi:pyridoxine kinase